jgi:hypothetical protein
MTFYLQTYPCCRLARRRADNRDVVPGTIPREEIKVASTLICA